jgi:hypothetical protein
MNGFDQVRSLIEYLVRGLVDQPEAVMVNMIQQEGGMLYRLEVARTDIDKFIGKKDHTSRSIRVVLSAIGVKLNRRLSLEITN